MSSSKRVLAALLAAAVLLPAAACGDAQSDSPSVTAAPSASDGGAPAAEEETTTVLMPDIPEGSNFGGYDFTFLNGNTAEWMTTYVVTAEEQNGEVVNDAIYDRNLAVAEKYGVTISEVSTTSVASTAQKSVTAGDDEYDVVLLTMSDALACTQKGIAVEYGQIPYIDIDKPWWVHGAMRDMSIGGRNYYGMSLFDTTHYDGVRAFYFNKTMRENYALDDPYQLIKDMKWTIDVFKTMGTSVYSDLDGDGSFSADDQYGYTSWSDVGVQALIYGVGALASVSKDENDMPVFTLNNPDEIERLTALASLLAEPGFKHPKGESANNGGVEFFKAGKTLFYSETMGNAQKLRTMDIDFGIVPGPMYNEQQGEYHNLGGNPYFMLIPLTAGDLSRTGIILEALAWESQDTIVPAFYDKMLNGKVARDEESGASLDIVFNTLSYYIPIAVSVTAVNLCTDVWKNKTDFASFFAKNEAKIQKVIDKAVAAFEAGT
ncbi:MAG: hypothetical protein IJT56_00140 [Clostridia bacterium]|nr:hypothetical protein [Clostridia bacterium]